MQSSILHRTERHTKRRTQTSSHQITSEAKAEKCKEAVTPTLQLLYSPLWPIYDLDGLIVLLLFLFIIFLGNNIT